MVVGKWVRWRSDEDYQQLAGGQDTITFSRIRIT